MSGERAQPEGKEHWLRRAEEARALAGQVHDRVAKETYLSVAQSCEQLAEWAKAESETAKGEPQ